MARLRARVGQRTSKGTLVTQAIQDAADADERFVELVVQDNSDKVKSAMDRALAQALEEIGQDAERFAKLATPVDTGRLRNSITHAISPDEGAVYIGTNVEYAPYVEHGHHDVGGKKMLYHAAADHGSWYRDIVRKHLGGDAGVSWEAD